MELTLAERRALTKTIATRYARSDKAGKGRVLDELCATTGWHRNHARKALKQALRPRIVKARRPRPPKYGPRVVAALIFCWATLGMPTGKRLAPMLPELVAILRRFGELDVDDDTATLLAGMSAATIDRRLAGERRKHELKGRSRTKPGSLLKSQIPVRTWADWDDAVPGFVEIDLVAHDGGNAAGEHAWTLTVTEIATGWTENRSVRNKARKWVLAALDDIARAMPFPILGVDSDNGSEFINHHLLAWCDKRQITFTRSRPGNKNDGCHVEQKNWAIVRTVVGYHRYDTEAELLLLNKIWALQSQLTNYFQPQQKLLSKVRAGAKVSKRYDRATTPHRRAEAHTKVSAEDKAILADTYTSINPAAVQRRIQALTSELLTLTTSKAGPSRKAPVTATSSRASSGESTTQTSRAS
jgi:integrase-like protein